MQSMQIIEAQQKRLWFIHRVGTLYKTGPVAKTELTADIIPRYHKYYLDKADTADIFAAASTVIIFSSNRLFVFHIPHITVSIFRATA